MSKRDWQKVVYRLGRVPDTVIADEMQVSKEAVRQQRVRRGIPRYTAAPEITQEVRACLGTASDADVAEKFGLTKTAVQMARRNAGIPAFRDTTGTLRAQIEDIDWENDIRTDAQIAQDLATRTSTVCTIRNELGVPTSRERGRPSTPRQPNRQFP